MVTEPPGHVHDRNNNTCPSHLSLSSKDVDENDDDRIKLGDDNDDNDNDTDDENIDVVIESDIEDQTRSRNESSRDDVVIKDTDTVSHRGGRRHFMGHFTTPQGSPPPLPIQQQPQTLVFQSHPIDRPPSTSPKENNNNNNSRRSSPNRTSHLSFGIDRILNETNNKQPTRISDDSADSGKDRDLDEDGRQLSFLHRVNNDAVSRVTSAASCVPSRMIQGVDLVSSLSPFHGAVLSRDVCRVEPPSLDILPVRPAWPDVYVCPWTGVQRDRFGLVRRVGHPYQNRTPPKRKKPRTAFSRQQVLELEKRFTRQKYLASAERSALAKTLSMTDAQVKTWFQNRRTKWRRQTAEEREIERQAAHKFLLSLRPDDTNTRSNIAAYSALCGVNQAGGESPQSPGTPPLN